MKREISYVVATVAMSAAVPAFAQSSVVLYGLIDEGLEFNTNAGGHPLYNMVSGVHGGSRFGLRGSEDLGGGMKAIFRLENGFDVNSGKLGQGGLMFGRQAYVGLTTRFGTLTLGRQYDSVVDYVGPVTVGDQWGGTIGSHPGDLDNFDNTQRTNNAVKYTSADYGGLTFGGLYSFGGIAGSAARNQVWSLGAGYNNGPLLLGVGYLNVRNPNVSFFGSSSSSTLTAATNNIASPVYSGYASANTYQVFGAGGNYTFGASTVGATYSYTRFAGLGDTKTSGPNTVHYTGSAFFNNVELSYKYQLTTALVLGAEYDYTRGTSVDGHDAAQYHQATVGADYFLSKRTDVYMIGVYQKALGFDSTGKPAVAAINQVTASTSDRQAVVRLGLRHTF
ncbi:porin [Paraburkholderia caffeinilytica]|uniref:porin n=1 Tax=Paraburkholderia caffeinilytica TaxID=1761016 RepID=UPI0038B9034D